MSVSAIEAFSKFRPVRLTEEDIGGLFILNPGQRLCSECINHFPENLTVLNVKEVAVRLIKITGEVAYFQRVNGERFAHENNNGWIPIQAVWSHIFNRGDVRSLFCIH
jgi:hypothetical protein